MALIFVLSSQSSLGGWTAPAWVQALRKAGHIVEYAALGLLIARALLAPGAWTEAAGREAQYRRVWWLGTAIATAYALTDELHQMFVPRRGAHLTDVVIDCLSAVAALGILYIVKTRRAAPGT
jgi:VanZ family protein